MGTVTGDTLQCTSWPTHKSSVSLGKWSVNGQFPISMQKSSPRMFMTAPPRKSEGCLQHVWMSLEGNFQPWRCWELIIVLTSFHHISSESPSEVSLWNRLLHLSSHSMRVTVTSCHISCHIYISSFRLQMYLVWSRRHDQFQSHLPLAQASQNTNGAVVVDQIGPQLLLFLGKLPTKKKT